MRVLPAPGYALLQIVKENIRKDGNLYLPAMAEQDTSFFNRFKIIEMGKNIATTAVGSGLKYKKGDIVVLSTAGAQMIVPGIMKNKDGNWIDVVIVSQLQMIATIEGDIGEDIVDSLPPPMIVPPTNVN